MPAMETNLSQKVSCTVNFAYDASEADELTIRPGDVIRDVERLPGGWWRGELRGNRGMFPDNFVSLLNEHATTRSTGVQGRCRALYSYQPVNPDELELCVGDVLEVLGEVEEGWWQGRRQGRVGVFPSNFVVMLDPPQPAPFELAPALPPKPVKEQCRVLFTYAAVNDDELNLNEGDIVTVISKEAPDRGWWRGELHGRVGLFPDNFVQLLPAATAEVEEKKPERPSKAATNSIYPILNKYTEKTASVKELTTSKISMHKDNPLSKETSTHSTVTHTSKNETEKFIHNEAATDGSIDGQVKKPPVPLKKSPTPVSGVGGLLSGLKNKMLSSSDKEKSTPVVVDSDRPDGATSSKPTPNANAATTTNANTTNTNTPNTNTPNINAPNNSTFDNIERNSILNDPRAGRVKAPRRRPPSQVLRDDTPQQIGLSNGHEVPASEKPPPEKAEEIKPRAREWEKHKAPWMEELKLNQAKKTSFAADGKARSVSSSAESSALASRAGGGSTDRILECGLDEKRSTHSMEMSKSTSSITSRMCVLESFEETKVRHSLDSKKETPDRSTPDPVPVIKPVMHSPTAAGRTFLSMVDDVKKPPAPAPPAAPTDKAPSTKHDKHATDKIEMNSTKTSSVFEKSSTVERVERIEERSPEKPVAAVGGDRTSASSTLERRPQPSRGEKAPPADGTDALIAQLNYRISNLEKLIEVQNSMFKASIEELNAKLKLESEKRQALQTEIEKLAHCVTQV
ncbi:CD2-associated protein-like isoform X1 [Bombyx mandarina]|uniref:CD2-associated protein-like isoform X1 n=2 Tax=Bombyx mandarina TaxID=7092 RepID=A0A6J2J9J3_BOMMA|nr:CD2-associated protein-like isoform X1 [Bombyx mandarina]